MSKNKQASDEAELRKKMAEMEKSRDLWLEYEEKFKRILDLSPCGIVIVDTKGKVISCNRASLEYTGFAREDVIGRKFTRLPYLRKKDIPRYIKIFSQLLKGERTKPLKVNWIHRDGMLHTAEAHIDFIKKKGKISGLVSIARDVSEQQKVEEILKVSEERYRSLFQQSNDAIFIHDPKGNIMDVNKKALELFEYEKNEMLALKIADLHPRSELGVSKKAFQTIAKNNYVDFECRFRKKNGDIFSAEVSASQFEAGDEKLIQGVVRDITERKRAEEALRKSEMRYRALFEFANDAVFIMNTRGEQLLVNNKAAQMLGYSVTELSGKHFKDVIASDEYEDAQNKLRGLLSGKSYKPYERVAKHKDGTEFPAEITATLIRNLEGEPLFIQSVVQDISERKRAEQEMRASEKKFRGVVENANDAIYIITPEGFEYVNPAFERLTGYTSKEACAEIFNFWNIIHPDDIRMIKEREAARKRGKYVPSRYEFRILAKNGKTKTVEPATVNIGQKGETKVMGILRDITDRKQAEEKIKASLQEKNILLSEIHHRVKNNMQIISSLLRLQSRVIGDDKLKEMFKESQNRIRSMALIHEKLYQTEDFSRINFGEYIRSLAVHLFHTYKVNPNVVKMNTEVKSVFLDINRAIPCGLIINELVSNSLKHAFPKNSKGEVYIKLTSTKGNKTKLAIGDTGIGLPRGINFNEPQTLGLQLVSDLVRQIEGKIRLERGIGTTFHISF